MPGGRPSPIDAVIGQREVDGHLVDVTVADRIIASLRAGVFLYEAAQAAGIGRSTAEGWMTLAGRLAIQYRGDLDTAPLSAHERRCIEFSGAVEEARALWLVDANTTHERLARGGIVQEVVTVEVVDGKEVKKSTRTTATLPDARTLEWRMKHIRPDLYAERLELTGAGGGPIELDQEIRVEALLDLARRHRDKKKDKEPEEPQRRRRRRLPTPEVTE